MGHNRAGVNRKNRLKRHRKEEKRLRSRPIGMPLYQWEIMQILGKAVIEEIDYTIIKSYRDLLVVNHDVATCEARDDDLPVLQLG